MAKSSLLTMCTLYCFACSIGKLLQFLQLSKLLLKRLLLWIRRWWSYSDKLIRYGGKHYGRLMHLNICRFNCYWIILMCQSRWTKTNQLRVNSQSYTFYIRLLNSINFEWAWNILVMMMSSMSSLVVSHNTMPKWMAISELLCMQLWLDYDYCLCVSMAFYVYVKYTITSLVQNQLRKISIVIFLCKKRKEKILQCHHTLCLTNN